MNFYIDQLLSPYLCAYRRVCGTQCPLLYLIERWKNVLHNTEYAKTRKGHDYRHCTKNEVFIRLNTQFSADLVTFTEKILH